MITGSYLGDPPTQADKDAIIGSVFGAFIPSASRFDGYLEYYNHEILVLRKLKYWSRRPDVWQFPIKTHLQMTCVIECLQEHNNQITREVARKAVRIALSLSSTNDEDIDAITDLALRLWLMVNFRSAADSGMGGGRPCVTWGESETLEACLDSCFPKLAEELTPGQRRLNHKFTIATMVRICGMKLSWTASLEDHLRLDKQHKTIWVFAHCEYLAQRARPAEHGSGHGRLQMTSPRSSSASVAVDTPTSHLECPKQSILPRNLCDETMRTLDLLFPIWDPATKQLLEKERQHVDRRRPRDRLLDLRRFPYWRERLLELNEDVFEAEAEGLAQLWRDRRDPQKFWTFWIALAVFGMAMVSMAASIVQTWASLKAIGYA